MTLFRFAVLSILIGCAGCTQTNTKATEPKFELRDGMPISELIAWIRYQHSIEQAEALIREQRFADRRDEWADRVAKLTTEVELEKERMNELMRTLHRNNQIIEGLRDQTIKLATSI